MHLFAGLLLLSLAGTGFSQQQYIENNHKGKKSYVVLNFDDLPTNSSGVGFHPSDPKQEALNYRSIYFQSFTLLNASSADRPRTDKQCSTSWPNSIFGSQKDGYAWPRISLHDLSKPKSELAEDVRKSSRTFSLESIHLKATGNITGSDSDTLGTISFVMMRLDPDPRKAPIPPKAGYPGLVRGAPMPLAIGNVTGFNVIFPPGVRDGFTLNPKQIFGDDFGRDTDVIEVTSQIFRKDKDKPIFRPAETWEVCLDDIILEIEEKDESKPVVAGNSVFHGIREDGSNIVKGDPESIVLAQMIPRA